MPSALMDTLMDEHGVSYGQTLTSTDIHKLKTTWVQNGQSICPNCTPPGFAVIAHMSVEDDGVFSTGTLQHLSQGLKKA